MQDKLSNQATASKPGQSNSKYENRGENMGAYTQGDLRVESAVFLENVNEFHMEIQAGCHGRIFLRGEVPEPEGKAVLMQGLDHEDLKILAKDDLIFCGCIQTVEVFHEGEGYQVSLHGISATAQLDRQKKNRTFQDTNMTFQSVMQEVLKDTKGAGLKFHAEDRKINAPVYQIEETDWELIKRLASHLKSAVVPVAVSENPVLRVGWKEGKLQHGETEETVCERTWFDRERSSICRSIRSYENWEIGERLSWEGTVYSIIEKSCRLEKGLLYFSYTIAGKEALSVRPYDNPEHTGWMLSGSVLDTREEQVKVKFDIDPVQPKETAFWYPWRPDAGNILYCMPEKGETVYVCLGDASGEKARAVCGVHKNGKGNPEMKCTDRYFTTAEQKRMLLTMDTLGFKDLKQESPLELLLHDNSGANIRSNRRLIISAKDRIGIKGNNIYFQAPKEISIVRRDQASPTVINLCNGFDSIGATNEVTASGTGGADFPVFPEREQEAGKEYRLDGIEKSIIASTPGKGLTGSLERQIEGIRVDGVTGEDAESEMW